MFSNVFQSYSDNVRVKIQGCAVEPVLWLVRFSPQAGLEPRTVRSAGCKTGHMVIDCTSAQTSL